MTQYQVGYSTSGRGDRAVAELKAAQFSYMDKTFGQLIADLS